MTSVLRWTVDLLGVLALTALGAAAIVVGLDGWVRAFLVVPLVLFLPGYALVAAVFPASPDRESGQLEAEHGGLKDPRLTKDGVDDVERLIFSVLASIVLVPLVAVAANFSPWGVTLTPILSGIVAVTVAFVVLAAIRRARRRPDDRYYPPMLAPVRGLAYTPNTTSLSRRGDRTRAFNVAFLLAIVVFASTVGYAAVSPPEGDGFTELAVETPNVTADTEALYPDQFGPDETRTLPLSLTNHEGERIEYDLVVELQRVDGAGENATVRERTEIDRRTIALDDGERANVSVDVSPSMTGDDLRLVAFAYAGDAPETPSLDGATQSLLLPVEVDGTNGETNDATASITPGP